MPTTKAQMSNLETDPKWTDSADYFDTQLSYKLTFPKHVVNNQHTRDNLIENSDIRDIKLVEVIWNEIRNWQLRSLAHGKFVTFEAFQSKLEALTMSNLAKLTRKDDATVNLDTIHNTYCKEHGLDPLQWSSKMEASKHISEHLLEMACAHDRAVGRRTLARCEQRQRRRRKRRAGQPRRRRRGRLRRHCGG